MAEEYLTGICEGDGEEFLMLGELFESGAFEIQKREDGIFDVPYMLNDALECYLVFYGAVMQGEFLEECREETKGSLVKEGMKRGLIIRQGEERTCTLWFTALKRELKCYRFDEIGHFWEKSAEQWRRLVYLIGTMQDKYLFLGEEVCNEEELKLIPLMEFIPFYRYYPAKVCIPEEYVMTKEGCLCMLKFAREAKDGAYASMIRLYLKFPCVFLMDRMHRMLLDVRRGGLYDLICQRAEAAASQYPKRDYGEEKNRMFEERREELAKRFLRAGYKGKYPNYQKGTVHVQVMEEHPFTRMEDFEEGLHFQLMVSRQPKETEGRNRGFFRGKGLKGRIYNPEEFFKDT